MPGPTWISVPDAADALGVRDRDVRQLVRDGRLVTVRSSTGAAGVAREMLDLAADPPAVVDGLPGTLTLLSDGGMSEAGVVAWLFEHDDELGEAPIDALRAGHVHAVRRVALAQAF
ncbi:Rv2175c family DNA-binding protein [Georgenia sp. Z1491]|uniref:Rv2175c family DNA-binding protein n=1 Tax=Georgenia sp. Z1491 TaxID=3416707 RepID=UPI003CF7B38E